MVVREPQHRWVVGQPGQLDPYPAVLIEWRQDQAGQWWGRVAYAVDRHVGVGLIDTWVQAKYLQRLRPEPERPPTRPRRFPD